MELKSNELWILEQGLDALIQSHEHNIDEINNIDDSYYNNRLNFNNLTVDELRQRDIDKEKKSIKEIYELREKLFLSDNYLLVVSNRIKLNISDK